MRKIVMVFFLCLSFCIKVNAQAIPIEKFVGVWNATNDNWSKRTMKISHEDGKIIVQVKDLIYGEAKLNSNRLEVTVVEEVEYGEFWVEDDNWIWHSIGVNSCGGLGEVGGYFTAYSPGAKASKEISYISVHVVYKYEGTLELYYTYHSTFYKGDTPLFYQSKEEDMYHLPWNPIVYTNW